MDKLQLSEFSNLTKSLNLNIYKICYAQYAHKQYISHINECFNALRLSQILEEVAKIVGATILNIAQQNYTPQGASVTMMVAEGISSTNSSLQLQKPSLLPETVVAHLDKSHIAVHTYPENHPTKGIQSFRIDIDVSTCGNIPPLHALNFIIEYFRPDVALMDYRIRGFTRSPKGTKLFNDHEISSITDSVTSSTLEHYRCLDINMLQENTLHTKMLLEDIDLTDHIFAPSTEKFQAGEEQHISYQIRKEMHEIFFGKNDSIKRS